MYGQLHMLVAVHLVPLEWKAGLALKLSWTLRKRDKSVSPSGNQTLKLIA
jgi:hypothetical protein